MNMEGFRFDNDSTLTAGYVSGKVLAPQSCGCRFNIQARSDKLCLD